jgi:tRNA threonylcarbamoyladenosine biosynthesis protein TsaB
MLLAIDSATSTASIALYDREHQSLLAEWTWQARRRHTQDLLPAARQLLMQSEVSPQQLSALAVTTGPGSFTGVRIGISLVKGLALGLPVLPQVIGVPTLNVTAAPWLAAIAACPALQICAYMQAGRGRYHWAYLAGEPSLYRLQEADHHSGTAAEFAVQLRQQPQTLLAGELTSELAEAVRPLIGVTVVVASFGWRRSGWLAHYAAPLLADGQNDSIETLQPIYLHHPAYGVSTSF